MITQIESIDDEAEQLNFLKDNLSLLEEIDNQQYLLKIGNKKIREFVLCYTQSEEILSLSILDESPINRLVVAQRTKKEETLFSLASDPLVWVRCAVAENKHATKRLLSLFLFGPERITQISALKNPKIVLFQDLIEAYVEKSDSVMLVPLLEISHLPPKVFSILLKREKSPYLIKFILGHRSLPKELLEPYLLVYPSGEVPREFGANELEKIMISLISSQKRDQNS
jgi:hypothetical protein